jgi:cytochrome c oxidase cbb3-type subunit 3
LLSKLSTKYVLSAVFIAGTAAGIYAQAQAPAARPQRKAPTGQGLLGQAGAADKHIVDADAAERGKKVYIQECITCHGPTARGGQGGSDLVRSLVVLKDRYGSEIGPFLKKGHQTQGSPAAQFSKEKIEDLADFLHLKVGDTLRTSPLFRAQNVLIGDAKAGEAYFKGDGKCTQCHSPEGNLKGIGAKFEPVDLQQRFLFPKPGFGRGGKPTMVTVTPPTGPAVTGTLVQIDDFNVSLRDADGEYRAWSRINGLKVKIDDPYAAHAQLLDRITDKNIHDVTAYLETLK